MSRDFFRLLIASFNRALRHQPQSTNLRPDVAASGEGRINQRDFEIHYWSYGPGYWY